VAQPDVILSELYRVLRPGAQALIGTWSWRHPFAAHLWAVMPVPWAHLLVSETTLFKVCRRVYHSPWYVPNMHDCDAEGNRIPDRFTQQSISRDYLNRFLIADFQRAFASAGFVCQTYLVPFGSPCAKWTRPLVRVPWLREFVSGYAWFVLTKLTV
jgi:hypothetical protein